MRLAKLADLADRVYILISRENVASSCVRVVESIRGRRVEQDVMQRYVCEYEMVQSRCI
jgi:hypothetical protein